MQFMRRSDIHVEGSSSTCTGNLAISLTITSCSDQPTFPIGGGGHTSAGRSANFDSFSEIGYQSP